MNGTRFENEIGVIKELTTQICDVFSHADVTNGHYYATWLAQEYYLWAQHVRIMAHGISQCSDNEAWVLDFFLKRINTEANLHMMVQSDIEHIGYKINEFDKFKTTSVFLNKLADKSIYASSVGLMAYAILRSHFFKELDSRLGKRLSKIYTLRGTKALRSCSSLVATNARSELNYFCRIGNQESRASLLTDLAIDYSAVLTEIRDAAGTVSQVASVSAM